MKNPPTLADACIATVNDRRYMAPSKRSEGIRAVLREVAYTRKFVLDSAMSRYLAELSDSFWRGGQRKRIRMLDNARRLARAPHALTWIEFDHLAYLNRIGQLKSQGVMDIGGNDPLRMGWLIHQHPQNEAAFRCCEIRSSSRNPERVFMHPLGTAWCSDDNPSPWPRFPPAWMMKTGDEIAEAVVEMAGYRTMQAHWHAFLGEMDTAGMISEMTKAVVDEQLPAATKPAIPARTLWALLATINDLPIKVEFVAPSKGYVARGSYKKFLTHSVIHLTVPETHWRKLVLKTAAALRRRAHQVRGHWRKDWRNPLSRLCEHDFDDNMVCRRCRGHQIWIAEHQRGDASLGFVTHDYEVHHEHNGDAR